MMTAYSEVVQWAEKRPWWQQKSLVQIASGKNFGDADFKDIADRILAGEPTAPTDGWLAGLQPPLESDVSSVKLLDICEVANVNRLKPQQQLTFSPSGLTVIYGYNGSGKSGYARLVKSLVRTRDKAQILPNVFKAEQQSPSATLNYLVGDSPQVAKLSENSPLELLKVAFYDDRCGDFYVRNEREVLYRPSALTMLDELVRVCSGVRTIIERKQADNSRKRVSLPAIPPDTDAGKFIEHLTHKTSDTNLDRYCVAPVDIDSQIETLRTEENRLRSTSPRKESERLNRLSHAFTTVHLNAKSITSALGKPTEDSLKNLREKEKAARLVAEEAANSTFETEPLDGVGSPAWKALWAAAKNYSETEAYPESSFPVTYDGRCCVLCQQILDTDSRDRLQRFHALLQNTTESEAKAAREKLSQAIAKIEVAPVGCLDVAGVLPDIKNENEELWIRVTDSLNVWRKRKKALVQGEAPPDILGTSLITELSELAEEYKKNAEAVDQEAFDTELRQLAYHQKELSATKLLADSLESIRGERDRLLEAFRLDQAHRETATTAISRFSGDLTKRHVTERVQEQFNSELADLRVESVALLGKGVKQGVALHKPEFVDAVIKAVLPDVLSEGEQTALGLAGFFVEARLDTSKSAIILDDPVTSLDHLRRDVVAKKLIEFAKDRQVIVFTHDVAFAAVVKKNADHHSVSVTERSIERALSGEFTGIVQGFHPWTVKDVKSRINDLGEDLARLRRREKSGDISASEYETEVAKWAGRLSQTWERIVSQEVADRLFNRSKLEVSITMVKIAERITSEDNKELQDSYSKCSGWTRHDQAVEIHYVPPSIDELQTELDRIGAWFKRVSDYKK